MRYAALLLAMTMLSATAMAAELKLDGEYGCDDPATQRTRAALMQNIVSDNPHYVAQRDEMREGLLNISTYMCKPLTGQFKVLKRADGYTQVETVHGPLWVTN
jgi:hypothetical protein